MSDGFDWVVIVGGYSGDGSKDHKLVRLSDGDSRVPFFNSQAAAEAFVLNHKLGENAVIAKVIVTASRATKLHYAESGRDLVVSAIPR